MAENKDDHAIPVAGILNWVDDFDENREELTKLFQSLNQSKIRPVDWEINTKISLFVGDIASLKVDGIVNPSSTTLAIGACGLAISKAAGPELAKELKTLNGCKTGEAKTTKGYNLPAKYVVHTAGPCGEDMPLLTKCYDSCLAEMTKHRMKSLAFSCISTGAFGFPDKEAACIALLAVRYYLDRLRKKAKLGSIERIIFCLFDEESVKAYKKCMQLIFPCGSEDEYVAWLIEKKEQELEPLDGFIQVTTSEPDEVMDDDDPNRRRAKMPCGHVIGIETMTSHCKSFLSEGKPVKCPYPKCDATWQYFLVRHVACLTFHQMQEFEQKISQNYIRKEEGTRQCPQCHVMCRRKDKDQLCVQCVLCTLKTSTTFLFCWECLGVWKFGADGRCGNEGCVEGDERISILEKCPMKRILDRFDAPSVRGCPNCGLLIEYLCYCTQMHCKGCDHYFCFLCLKGAKTKAELTCDPYQSTCIIAPRQTTLPGM